MGKSLTLDIGKLVDGLGRRGGKKKYRGMRGATTYYRPSLSVKGIRLAPSRAEMDPMNMLLGFALIPTAVAVGGRLGAASGLLGDEAKLSSRAGDKSNAEKYLELGAFGANLLGQLFVPGRKSSFFFGSLIGQVPTAVACAGDLIAGLFEEKAPAPAEEAPGEAPTAQTKGMGRLTDSEIRALVSGRGNGMSSYVTDLTNTGMDRSGHYAGMGSTITDMVDY